MSDMTPSQDFDSRTFRDALSKFATGVALITTRHRGRAVGIVVNSFASVSLEPPLVLWSIHKDSRRRPAFEETTQHAIHILSAAQRAQCLALTRDSGAFDGLPLVDTPDGPPLIEGCLARFETAPFTRVEAGDHITLIQNVVTSAHQDSDPLVFFDKGFGHLFKGPQ